MNRAARSAAVKRSGAFLDLRQRAVSLARPSIANERLLDEESNHVGLLRSPWDMLHVAFATEYFTLTLTLSLREREQQASGWCVTNGCWANSGTGVIERLWTILPLPRGEGRGEGEPRVAHPTVRSV